MNYRFWFILVFYMLMQLSGLFGIPVLYLFGVKGLDIAPGRMESLASGYWLVYSFSATLLVMWLILRKGDKVTSLEKSEPTIPLHAVIWAFNGMLLAFLAQFVAIQIESLMGIKMGSENTDLLVKLTKQVPLAILVITILGPIIEELVFRKVIFGSLYSRMNFFYAALISSLIFGLIHLDFQHLLVYTGMGFVFAYVYKVTKRIWVPIVAHVAMNSTVMLVQLFS